MSLTDYRAKWEWTVRPFKEQAIREAVENLRRKSNTTASEA